MEANTDCRRCRTSLKADFLPLALFVLLLLVEMSSSSLFPLSRCARTPHCSAVETADRPPLGFFARNHSHNTSDSAVLVEMETVQALPCGDSTVATDSAARLCGRASSGYRSITSQYCQRLAQPS